MNTTTLLSDREHRQLCWRYLRGRITWDEYWDAAYQRGDGLDAMDRAEHAVWWRVMLAPILCGIGFFTITAAFGLGYVSSWTFDAVFYVMELSLIAMLGAAVAFLIHHTRSLP